MAAIGGGAAVSRIGRLGAVASRDTAGGNRSSSVRGEPGASDGVDTGAGITGADEGDSNAADNAADAALIAANAEGGSHGGGSGRPTADGVCADCAASGGGGAAMLIGLATG